MMHDRVIDRKNKGNTWLRLLSVYVLLTVLVVMLAGQSLYAQKKAKKAKAKSDVNQSVMASQGISLRTVDQAKYVPHEVLVVMEADEGEAIDPTGHRPFAQAERVLKGRVARRYRLSNRRQVVRVKLPTDLTVRQAIAENWRSKDHRIKRVEPNYIVHLNQLPNDSRFSELWGMNNTGQTSGQTDADIDAVEAWDITTGSSDIVVAVIDSGVDYLHPDLAGNMWINTDEIAGNGIDDDGNGYVDDIYGYDFLNEDSDPTDANSHGTHCAGTIAAQGNNGVGVAGVNWNCQIMACRFLDADGSGPTSAAIEAIYYAVDNGANVLSNSWGGGSYSEALEEAIIYARDHGVLFCAAAGNSGEDIDAIPQYPASYDVSNVISIAATNDQDGIASFSNYGELSVDLGAPGVDILSSVPRKQIIFEEDFEDANVPGLIGTIFTPEGNANWVTINNAVSTGNVALRVDSVNYPYSANRSGALLSPIYDIRGLRGISLEFSYRYEIHENDMFKIEAWNGSAWEEIFSRNNTENYLSYYYGIAVDIPDRMRTDSFQLRFAWETDSQDNSYFGMELDNIILKHVVDNLGDYDYKDGTSMATPHVAGAAALVLATNPDMPLNELKVRLTSTGDKVSSLSSKTSTGTRLNVHQAIIAPDGLSLTYPNGGEVLAKELSYSIQWNVIGQREEDVAIELYRNGDYLQDITPSTTNDGEYLWTIPAELEIAQGYQVLITDGVNSDMSDNAFSIVESADYYTEEFSTVDSFDLDGLAVHFYPDGQSYTACIETASGLTINPLNGVDINLGDDDSIYVSFVDMAALFYGVSYSRVYVGSNGYLTFGSSSTAYDQDYDSHFSLPRISALFCDLDPEEGGRVSYLQGADYFAVTWENLPEYGEDNSNTFQIILYADGEIEMVWFGVDARAGIVGLSQGLGLPADFFESNLSELNQCSNTGLIPPLAYDFTVTVPDDNGILIGLQVSDDGQPDPPAVLTYLVDSLPQFGILVDPATNQAIESVPYMLANNSGTVLYYPDGSESNDSFTYYANDGGVAPDGGDSNLATVTIEYRAVVSIPDTSLKSAIEVELGVVDPTATDMLELRSLTDYSWQVTSLVGLETATNLEHLHLDYCQVSDLSPLADLQYLKDLSLVDNSVQSLAPLAGLTSLEELNVLGNPIVDVTGLDQLVSLQRLIISSRAISNLSFITPLTNLITLDMEGFPAESLQPLASLNKLESLTLEAMDIDDISPLVSLDSLAFLSLWKLPVTDIDSLSTLDTLMVLDMSELNVTDLSPLSQMNSLSSVYIYALPVSDLSPLSAMVNLRELYVDYCFISNLSPLASLTQMMKLSLAGNFISDLSPLSNMTMLSGLHLEDNYIRDLSPLAGLSMLSTLELSDNIVSDLSPLSALPPAGQIILEHNAISDLQPIENWVGFVGLELKDNPLDEIAYCRSIPLLESNNPGASIGYDPNPFSFEGDATGDCQVDLNDFAVLASQWLAFGCGDCNGANLDEDIAGQVDLNDLLILVENWMINTELP